MMYLFTFFVFLLTSIDAQATRYWVDPAGSDANSCASIDGADDPGVYRLTPAAGKACLAGGDTLTIKSGTYTGSGAIVTQVPGGPSAANPTIVEGDPSSAAGCALTSSCPTLFRPSGLSAGVLITASHVVYRKIRIDHVNLNTKSPLAINGVGITDFLIEDMELFGAEGADPVNRCGFGTGLGSTPQTSFLTVRRVNSHHHGNTATGQHCGHAMYLEGDDTVVEYSLAHDASSVGLQCFTDHTTSDGRADRCTVRHSAFYNNRQSGVILEGWDDRISNSVSYGNASSGIIIYSSALRTKANNNVVYNNGNDGVQVRASAHNAEVQNNIIFGNATAVNKITGVTGVVESYNACSSGQSCGSTGKVTIAAITACTVSTSDFSQKSGSSCINAGTIISGFNYNGSAPDIGAFESVPDPACSMTTNVITCIFPMSLNVPIQNLSTAGVTVGCTGTNCPGGGLTASAVSRVVNTDTHVEIRVAGFPGDACVATNQAVTLTYASATGTWTDTANIGPTPGAHQPIFSFASLAVANQCTGSGPAGYPAGYHIYYKFDENTGTNVNDESANNLDCTFTNTPTWGPGKTGSAMVVAAGGTAHCAIPWGSGVNPYSTDLTIVAPVLIADGTTNATHFVVGPSNGTNQRFYICSYLGTWRISYQAVACEATASSNLAVTNGWNHLTLRTNGTTHVATLYLNGVVGSGGASVTLTSYTLASNLTLGRVASVTTSGGSYDEFLVYLSLQDPATIYAAFQAVATPAGGTLAQAAVQFQGVYLDVTGNVRIFGALNGTQDVVKRGGGAIVFQIHCQPGAPCDETGFKLVYAKNQTAADARAAGTYITAPNTETSDGFWFWGDTAAALNSGITTTRLTGSCTVTNGATQLTADQVPSVALPSDGCIMLRYIFRVGDGVNDYFEPFLVTPSGLVLPGGYADGRINVVPPRGSAF